ncbi:hypothetical protein ON010_g18829 [Phytophthora cinnamomi]|nr:hypothetical protein ON010_g18829 [Phytophthora cinnamomi]
MSCSEGEDGFKVTDSRVDVSLANYRDRGGNDTAPRWHRAAVCNVADEHDANHPPDPALRLAFDYMQLECIHQLAAESSSASQRRPHKLHFAQLPYCLKMLRSLAENSFSVMSYNVAGLPEILSSGNPSENSVEIGKRISNWDVVNVQEDFNYHAYIYSENSHLYRTATSGGVPFGDGLNTLSNYSFSNITDLTRTKWEDCSTFDGADCLTPKGFTFLEIQLADGVTFDLYNLHTDAGVTDADEVARAANLAQLSEYITANSADNAVIVMGDTNTRYTRSDDTIPT